MDAARSGRLRLRLRLRLRPEPDPAGTLCAKTAPARAGRRQQPSLRCETVIIPEMTARRLITHAARYFYCFSDGRRA
jgi:hypothetical protein